MRGADASEFGDLYGREITIIIHNVAECNMVGVWSHLTVRRYVGWTVPQWAAMVAAAVAAGAVAGWFGFRAVERVVAGLAQ